MEPPAIKVDQVRISVIYGVSRAVKVKVTIGVIATADRGATSYSRVGQNWHEKLLCDASTVDPCVRADHVTRMRRMLKQIADIPYYSHQNITGSDGIRKPGSKKRTKLMWCIPTKYTPQ